MTANSIATNTVLPASNSKSNSTDGDATKLAMAQMKATTPDPSDGPRPAMSQTWQTERPPAATRSSIAPSEMARHPTNVSAFNEAIQADLRDTDDASRTSSSSSDDDDDGDDSSKQKRFQRARGRTRGQGQGKKGHGGSFSRFHVGNKDYQTKGRVSKKDGRLNISINENNNRGYLAKALGGAFLKQDGPRKRESGAAAAHKPDDGEFSKALSVPAAASDLPIPKLNIVVMVIGSRGDIQPFLKLGKRLQECGHRVRIATHPAFKDFVQRDSGLEFFSVGGDPAELMAFMVKNPGMIPTMETLKKGEVGRRRSQMAEMFEGFWRACINATDDEHDEVNRKMMSLKSPFIADAIIANPPSFAHVHCAERLGIPLHLMFTFPYTPTQNFPHPLANIKKTNLEQEYVNLMSYPLVEMMTWQGLGDLINNFRVKTLGLEPVSTLWAPGQLYRLKVPYTYLWSPALIPKPFDWGPEIDIAGFVFLDLASSFTPPEDLVKFLDAGEPPVYIGFGSIVVDDPDKFTQMIFEAIEKAGVRALVSKGWGELGGDINIPDHIYMLGNTPHDWLFPKVRAVVHHGGAGTTAIGLKCGKPTMIVPFFGDQQFWGTMIGGAGAGSDPVPHKGLTADKLAEGIEECLTDEANEAAQKLAASIEAEGDGAKNAVESFHRHLVLRGERSMRCSILEDRVAVWRVKSSNLRLSALAADLLVGMNKLHWKQLRLIRHHEWNDFDGPGEPLTGGATAILGTVTGAAAGVGSVPFRVAKTARKRTIREEKKKSKAQESPETRSGNGSATKRNSKEQNGKLVNESQPNGSANAGKGKVEKEPASNLEIGKDAAEKTGSHAAPNTEKDSLDHVKSSIWPGGMGGHTVRGEPVRQKHEANREEAEGKDNKSLTSNDLEDNTAEQFAQDVGEGLGQTAESIARLPMDLALAVAQGFHNAPRLYGDVTVRRPTRITGLKSGLKASGKEFVFGIYDGVTGLVVHPYTGARDRGPLGFVRGVGMGLTGFVLKDLAAITGPIAYTLKGAHKELLKSKQPTKFIRRAKIMHGYLDHQGLNETKLQEVKAVVTHGWSIVQQVSDAMDGQLRQGLRGKIRFMNQRRMLKEKGGFENIEKAEKALDAWKKGGRFNGFAGEGEKQPKKTMINAKKDIPQDEDTKLTGKAGAQANGSNKPQNLQRASTHG
ncbi:UDP-Glycosyltransferase phosphorylase [Venustampulla echinocandica]|uniref:UDP-Glycosyltransferase phosphorylase n=1 Tax=Venustampulla echinocandica TaxID=2656787 RepID=A0A370TNX5_9HELO|nr:UDP-Glycosyltransferase phosphorylase [Venustampulla echinocandica]RDL37221.1 UDP-Glycosyltransferase phosphorylase [Venustampulla echinocandica]